MVDKYLTLKDVALALNVSYQTIHKYIKNKQLGAVRVGGRWRISQEEVEKFIQDMTSNSFASKEDKEEI